jgi:hypothetical protein
MNLSPTVTVFAAHAAELPRAFNPATENSLTPSQKTTCGVVFGLKNAYESLNSVIF